MLQLKAYQNIFGSYLLKKYDVRRPAGDFPKRKRIRVSSYSFAEVYPQLDPFFGGINDSGAAERLISLSSPVGFPITPILRRTSPHWRGTCVRKLLPVDNSSCGWVLLNLPKTAPA
jgi:hypothetical protein